MAGRFFDTPFGVLGDRIAVPDASQPDGSVSYAQGFGFDYERPNTDPAYKPVPREQTNAIYHDITEALGIMQSQGVADWYPEATPYPIKALVRHNNEVWLSKVSNNTDSPLQGLSWEKLGAESSTSNPGLIKIASTSQAQQLTDDTTALTPKKLADAFGGPNSSLTPVGRQMLPNGVLRQWGFYNYPDIVGSTQFSIVFPVTFPSGIFSFLFSVDTVQAGVSGVVNGRTTSGINVVLTEPNTQVAGGTIFWVAEGR